MTTADPTATRPASATGKRLLGVEEARATILSAVAPPDPSAAAPIALEQAAGRVLATDVVAALSMPRWPNSAMDGYALRFDDLDGSALSRDDVVVDFDDGVSARRHVVAVSRDGADDDAV